MMMKKLFFVILTCLMAGSLQAQSIVGIWKSTEKLKNGEESKFYYTIEQSKYSFRYVTEMRSEEYGAHIITIEAPGTYTYSGNVFSGQYNSKDVKIDARLIVLPKESGGNRGILEALMITEARARLNRFFSRPVITERWEVASLSDSKMVLNSGQTFTRLNDSSLTGTWKTVVKHGEDEEDVSEQYITFGQKASIKVIGELPFENGRLFYTLTEPLLYCRNGNKFEFEPIIDQAKVTVDKMEVDSEVQKKLDQNPQLKKDVMDRIKSSVERNKKGLALDVPSGNLTIMILEDDAMSLVDVLGKIFTFVRIDSTPQTSGVSEVAFTFNEKVYESAETMPGFPGGSDGLFRFIANNLKYPLVCEENGIQGRVVCSFIVEQDGSISNISVVKSVNPALDKEAKRVLSLMPKWTPGREKGQPVRVKYSVPVTFTLR